MTNVSSTSTEPHLVARALPHSRGKASQWPAFTPVPLSKIGLIRHTTSDLAQHYRTSHLWQGGIGPGPSDCNALPATSQELV